MEEKKMNTKDLNFGPCGPVCPSRVEMISKSYSNGWTAEDKQEIRKSFADYKGRDDAKKEFLKANMRKMTCCICGCDFIDWTGNNPYPFGDGEKESCCNDCNNRFVIPARLNFREAI